MTDNGILIVLQATKNAELTKSDISLLIALLSHETKSIDTKNGILAKELGIKIPNVIRGLRSLEDKNVIGYRPKTHNIFVKAIKQWKAPK